MEELQRAVKKKMNNVDKSDVNKELCLKKRIKKEIDVNDTHLAAYMNGGFTKRSSTSTRQYT